MAPPNTTITTTAAATTTTVAAAAAAGSIDRHLKDFSMELDFDQVNGANWIYGEISLRCSSSSSWVQFPGHYLEGLSSVLMPCLKDFH